MNSDRLTFLNSHGRTKVFASAFALSVGALLAWNSASVAQFGGGNPPPNTEAQPTVTSITLKAGVVDEKTIGDVLVKSDFDLTTDPPGHEDEVSVPDTTVAVGDNWVVATLNGTAQTDVIGAVGSGGWGEVSDGATGYDDVAFTAEIDGTDGNYTVTGDAVGGGDTDGALSDGVSFDGTAHMTWPTPSGDLYEGSSRLHVLPPHLKAFDPSLASIPAPLASGWINAGEGTESTKGTLKMDPGEVIKAGQWVYLWIVTDGTAPTSAGNPTRPLSVNDVATSTWAPALSTSTLTASGHGAWREAAGVWIGSYSPDCTADVAAPSAVNTTDSVTHITAWIYTKAVVNSADNAAFSGVDPAFGMKAGAASSALGILGGKTNVRSADAIGQLDGPATWSNKTDGRTIRVRWHS